MAKPAKKRWFTIAWLDRWRFVPKSDNAETKRLLGYARH